MFTRKKTTQHNHRHLTPLQRQAQVNVIHQQLPQTQCRRCGFNDCEAYAQAIADQKAPINRCQPGGQEGIERLAKITKQKNTTLAQDVGEESPRTLAVIDENWCIGCTKCIQACPVDAIMGSSKKMHTVLENHCTGCELCAPMCPTDCIQFIASSDSPIAPTGWSAWSQEQASRALSRYSLHQSKKKMRKKPTKAAHVGALEDHIASTSEHEKRNYMASIMLKAQQRQR